jgi:tetratricopeptide (TPR) repeat protein
MLHRLERERQDALVEVDRILRQTARSDIGTLAERTELRTAGALDRLTDLIAEELTRDPPYAEALALLAHSIAEVLPPVYPTVTVRQLRAQAWRDLGKVRSFLARHAEALDAFAHAEAVLEEGYMLGHDLALVRLNVALTYQEVGRFEEARALIAECKTVLHNYGDIALYVLAGFYEGVLLQRLQQYREAREVLLLTMASFDKIPPGTLAALHHAIGLCSMELRDFEPAEHHIAKGIEMFRSLRQPIDAINGEYARGRLLLRKGRLEAAIQHLEPVRHQFLKHSMAEEAGLCGLEIVEGLLALNHAARAERLARTVVSEFLAAGLSERAITAVGWLTEAIAAKKAGRRHVTHVRDYIVSLRAHPEREFTLEIPPRDGE